MDQYECLAKVMDAEGYDPGFKNWWKDNSQFAIGSRLEMHSGCNARCVHCPRSLMTRPQIPMDRETFIKCIDGFKDFSKPPDYIWLHLNGETLLLDIDELCWRIDYAANRWPLPNTWIGFFTNGQLLTLEKSAKILKTKLYRLAFSIDGGNKHDYESVRVGLNWETVTGNLKEFCRLNKEAGDPIITQTIIVPQQGNKTSIGEYFALMKEFGVKEPGGTGITNIGGTIDAENMKIMGHQYDGGDPHAPCWRVFTEINVCADGDVVACCQDVLAKVVLGNVNQNTLREIWDGEPWTKLRTEFLQRKHPNLSPEFDMCNKCDVMRSFEIPESISYWNSGGKK